MTAVFSVHGPKRVSGLHSSEFVTLSPAPAAGRHSGRREADRGVQAGQPRHVQLGDPGQAAEGRSV